jgi:hypothetical protein
VTSDPMTPPTPEPPGPATRRQGYRLTFMYAIMNSK